MPYIYFGGCAGVPTQIPNLASDRVPLVILPRMARIGLSALRIISESLTLV